MLVVDASIVVKTMVEEPGAEAAAILLSEHPERIAPELIAIEVASALSKKVRYDGLPASTASTLLTYLDKLIGEQLPNALLLDSALTLSVELKHALQDCLYLALAELRDCSLATADAKFAARLVGTVHEKRLIQLR